MFEPQHTRTGRRLLDRQLGHGRSRVSGQTDRRGVEHQHPRRGTPGAGDLEQLLFAPGKELGRDVSSGPERTETFERLACPPGAPSGQTERFLDRTAPDPLSVSH
ncbi:MAG TPA: hypothetical protein VIX84_01485 [Acidimicrobiales bacterium]